MLGVQQIDYAEEERPEEQKLNQVCDDVNFLYSNVHVGGFWHIRVIGPSVSSHLFYKRVEDRIAKHKDTLRMS